MTIEGVDYSDARPSPSGLYAAGKRFACRYGGKGRESKQLTAAERDALVAAGMAIVSNVEGTEGGLLGGRAVGRDWAQAGLNHFTPLGMGANRPIYLSLDVNPNELTAEQWFALDAAMDGAADVLGRARVGLYGGHKAIAHCMANGKAPWGWQTYAWSGWTDSDGVYRVHWHPDAQIQQYKNNQTVAGTSGIDLNRATVVDYGQWGVGVIGEDDDMFCKHGDAGKKVAALQNLLRRCGRSEVVIDGQYGDQTAVALSEVLDKKTDGKTYDPWQYGALFDKLARMHPGPAGPPGPPGPQGEPGQPGAGVEPGTQFTVTVV